MRGVEGVALLPGVRIRFRREREVRELTTKMLAARRETSLSAVYKFESGTGVVSRDVVLSWLRTLGMEEEEAQVWLEKNSVRAVDEEDDVEEEVDS